MSAGLDETSRELLEQNRDERDKMDAEIQELRRRNVRTDNSSVKPPPPSIIIIIITSLLIDTWPNVP